MLRSILRNVQHYLLFFSIILVLLAFQRLRWYDQGILGQPYGFDRPYTSPDNAGRVLWDGESSKEIGLFKFRLGLFHFALPTFSKDDSSWERTSSAFHPMMSVPLPPNKKRRKSAERMYSKLKEQAQLQLKNSKRKVNAKAESTHPTSKASIAYVVILPQQLLPIAKNMEVLPNSIKRAHTNSSYDYELFGLTLNRASTTKYVSVVRDFKIISGEDIKLKADSSLKENGTQCLPELLRQHDIIVQLSPKSFLLRPLDDLFKSLAAKEAESFACEPLGASSSDKLIVFRSSSKEASSLYMKSLSCMSLIPTKNQESDLHCRALSGTSLDPCLYDAGTYNTDHNCSHVSVEDARVAHFPKPSDQQGNIQCVQPWVKPWESLSKGNCPQNKKSSQTCTWLCNKWLSFVAINREAS